jgi:predicted site-specific integrase-resolvase
MAQNDVVVTPKQLAADLPVPAKTIRSWLRSSGFRPDVEKGARWLLTDEQAKLVRERFGH